MVKDSKEVKKRGRKPLPDNEKKILINFRVAPKVEKKIKAQANQTSYIENLVLEDIEVNGEG